MRRHTKHRIGIAFAGAVIVSACARDNASPRAESTTVVQVAKPTLIDSGDFHGLSLKVEKATLRTEPLFINDPVFTLGDAPPSKQPMGKTFPVSGALWLVTVRVTQRGDSTLWVREMVLLDDSSRKFDGLGGGDGNFYLKGAGLDRSGTFVLAFEVAKGIRRAKLVPMPGGPQLDVVLSDGAQ